MIDKLISFSIKNKVVIGFFTIALIIWGVYSFRQIPIDAVPDITTNQVQIITQSSTLATQEVEQYITFPIETSLANIPDVAEIRSISRFGLSVITVVFEDYVDIYLARQLISEKLKAAEADIPPEFGRPGLGPITTGLGEVYQYVLRAEEGYDSLYSDMELRTIHDWIVKRQLAGTPGVIEVSGWGGHLKQYEVAINPEQLNSFNISINEVYNALKNNNENTGGSYIEKKHNTYFLRGEGLVKSIEDIGRIVVKNIDGFPVLIRDIGTVGYGSAPRYGAITWNGKGEVVGGQALMLKGENSYEVVAAIKERIIEIQKSLPEGVVIEPYLDRSELIGRAIGTVKTNLIEGGLIVILVLVLLLGNFRGGLIVASVIPLSLLFAMGMMNVFGVSANLMSLGAIDFGLVVDGSVIIVEAIMHRLYSKFGGQTLSRKDMDIEVGTAASRIRSSAAFGEVIILIVYLPILALVGIEGKMFGPMAQTVSFAIAGALILSMTYIPMMTSAFLSKKISNKKTLSDRFISKVQAVYEPLLKICVKRSNVVIGTSVLIFGLSAMTFNKMGGEFIPVLEEGDFALHQILPPGSSLQQSVDVSQKIQQALLDSFPEVETVVSKIGTSEIPTDPMPIEVGDIIVRMRPKSEWVSANTKEDMFEKMEAVLTQIPGVQYEFTQPIQMRFNELIAGVREDIAIKIFGENTGVLAIKAQEAKTLIQNIEGVGDLRVESTQGLPQITVKYDRNKIAQYGLTIKDVNQTLRTAFGGEIAGQVFEEERRFDLVVRYQKSYRDSIDDIRNIYVQTNNGAAIPLRELAEVVYEDGPIQISREDTKRKIVIGVNSRGRDIESLVEEIQDKLDANLDLPPGYHIKYGGQYENLKEAKKRLYIAAPMALLLIFVLLFLTFNSAKQAILIFTAIPFSAIGGIYALHFRGLPFSISAGIGFIALFGVAVLNGIVLIAYFNYLKKAGVTDIRERIFKGTEVRLRPVLMTAAVAALGFLPMALSNSAGAEVQRPLATVVIGGLISATILTLLVLPLLYEKFERMKLPKKGIKKIGVLSLLIFAQTYSHAQTDQINLQEAITIAKDNHPNVSIAKLELKQQVSLKKTAFELAPTEVKLSKGELNSADIDYQIEISQSFDLPFVYSRKAKWYDEKIELSRIKVSLAELEVEKQVRASWYNWLFVKSKESKFEEQLALYKDVQQTVTLRFEEGEIDLLKKTYIDNKFRILNLENIKVKQESQRLKALILLAIGTTDDLEFAVDSLRTLSFNSELQTTNSYNSMRQYTEQGIKVSEQLNRVEKSKLIPRLQVGYLNQQIEGVENLQGMQFGIGIPLFFGAQKARISASNMQIEISKQKFSQKQLEYHNNFQAELLRLSQQAKMIAMYEDYGNAQAATIRKLAKKSFDLGELNYLQYTTLVEGAFELEFKQLDAINEYNQTVIKLQSYNGRFNEK
jgi:heavy metal efflux system protein